MTQFNSQQTQAIQALGRNILVSASAGAGKTTVLIARLMKRILEDDVSLQEVVALTFTEAAAKEMKNRLLASLHDHYQKQPTPFLKQQIAYVETAQITTLHAFCLTLIKNYGYLLGLHPSRSENILDETQATLLKQRALDDVFNEEYQERFEHLEILLDTFSANPLNTRNLKEAVLKTAQWLNQQTHREQTIQSTLSLYQSRNFTDLPDTYKTLFFNMYFSNLSVLQDLLKDLIYLSGNYDADHPKADKMQTQMQTLKTTTAHIQTLLEQIKHHDLQFYDQLESCLDIRLLADSKNEAYTDKRKQFEKEMKSFVAYLTPLDEQFALIQQQAPLIQDLLRLADRYLHAYSRYKEKENALDFDDFEHFAYQILTLNHHEVARFYQATLKEIMVDEFQDTNDFQDEIIRLISNGHNVFRVGDVKQSIYRFRGAKPEIMQGILKDSETEKLFLSYNYRSKEAIVAYNNTVFDALFNATTGMDFKDYDTVDVGLESQKTDSFPVELHFIETEGSEAKGNSDIHAQHIAQEIIRFHQEENYDFKDMVVLVRSHANKTYLKKAFERFNIPHYIDDRSGFYHSRVAEYVKAFLNYAVSFDDYDLITLLMSPYFDLSYDDLAHFKLSAASFAKGVPEGIRQQIHELVRLWPYQDLVTILQSIVNFHDVYHLKFSIQDKTNMDALLEKAIQYQEKQAPTLTGFLRYLEHFTDDTSSEASPLNKDDDVVTSMTIHQSKGLQFPVVFVWGMGSHKVQDHRELLIHDETYGLALNHLTLPYRVHTKPLLRLMIEFHQDTQTLEEDLRLLYVALTRPQQRLILSSVVKKYMHSDFSINLLRNHRSKQELIAAISPSDTTLILKNADTLNTQSLPPAQTAAADPFPISRIPRTQPQRSYQNEPLDHTYRSAEGMEYGTLLHQAIETLPHAQWDDAMLEGYEKNYRTALKRYNQHPFTQQLFAYPHLEHEMPYLHETESGIVDFFAYDDDTLVIVDFKSDAVAVPVLIERHQEQVERYIQALQPFFAHHRIEAYLYSFHHHDYLKIR